MKAVMFKFVFVFYFSDVLTYHVVKGTVWSASLSDGVTPATVEGKTITIKVGAGK